MFTFKNITTIQFDSGKDLIKIILTYSYLMSLLEGIVFFYTLICHISKQIKMWRVKFEEPFGDALRLL